MLKPLTPYPLSHKGRGGKADLYLVHLHLDDLFATPEENLVELKFLSL